VPPRVLGRLEVETRFLLPSVRISWEAVRPEKLIRPEELRPVAEVMAPVELIWNWEEEPAEKEPATVRRLVRVVVPIPTFPFSKIVNTEATLPLVKSAK